MIKKLLLLISLLSLFSFINAFPSDFVFGTATAAYQVEGAFKEGGRGPSIWDYFSHYPGTCNGDNGDITDDFYHRYPEDIKMMKEMGLKNFRMSISWTRIFPGDDYSKPNAEGVRFYNNVINTLLANGIEPWVTLFHWDLPQVYNDFSAKGTWLNENIPQKFNLFADFCFKAFGDRVKYWLTFNEIQTFAWNGYGNGVHAPGRCSPGTEGCNREVGGGGNSSTEPYIVGHNALIAHALAVKTYREKYQKKQKGKIGMTITSDYIIPYNISDPKDIESSNAQLAFSFGWFADPIVFGDYPKEMKSRVSNNRLPVFNETMKKLLKNSCDFLGFNYYATFYGKHLTEQGTDFSSDPQNSKLRCNATGHCMPLAQSTWLQIHPKGIHDELHWINNRYNRNKKAERTYPIYIFESGVDCPEEDSDKSIERALNDTCRVNLVSETLSYVEKASNEGVPVKGYFLWSLMDNFEWNNGLSYRFGIVHVDFKTLKRTIKKSGHWYSAFVKKQQKKKI